MPKKARRPFFDKDKIARQVSQTLGDSVRSTFIAYLGDPTTLEVEVTIDQADHAGMYFIHGVSAQNFAITGNEGSSTDDKSYVTTAFMTPNTILPGQMIYGTAVKVKRENGLFTITDLAGIQAAEYLYGLKDRIQRSVDISQIDFGLLKPTSPESFRFVISGARYYLDGVAYDAPTVESQDFSTEIPGTPGLAKAYLIEFNPVDLSITYTSSLSFTNNAQHSSVFSHYPKNVSLSKFACGWLKIYNGMASIGINDLYSGQEFLNKVSTPIPTAATLFPLILTIAAEVVVDDDGEVMWIESV